MSFFKRRYVGEHAEQVRWSWSPLGECTPTDDHVEMIIGSTLHGYHQLDSTRYIFSGKGPVEREFEREVATCASGYRELEPSSGRPPQRQTPSTITLVTQPQNLEE